MKKIKVLPCILAVIFLINICQINIYAYEIENLELAEYLDELDLFCGTDKGYELDQTATRVEGAVMVVRLLGKEAEALENNYSHPFLDVPEWADPYVGYLYTYKITNGTSDTTFDSLELLTGNQYMTLLLRVMAYDDSSGDFSWDQSLLAAYQYGMLSDVAYGKYEENTSFLRDDLVYFTYCVLNSNRKNTTQTLYAYLVEQGVIVVDKVGEEEETEEAEGTQEEEVVEEATSLGADETDEEEINENSIQINPYEGESVNTKPLSLDELERSIEVAVYNMSGTMVFNVKNCYLSNYTEVINGALDNLKNVPSCYSIVDGWSYYLSGNTLSLSMNYRITKDEVDEAKVMAGKIIEEIIDDTMTTYEKELAIHDYLVNTVNYDYSTVIPEESYTLYGALILNSAVCQGYADAFAYLCALVDIECILVVGSTDSNGQDISHAWNQVYLDGDYYFVDVTWDDPTIVNGENGLRYTYFNVSSDELSGDHTWDEEAYEVSEGSRYNYYVYNDLVIYNIAEFRIRFKECVANKETNLYLKLEGETVTTSEISRTMKQVDGWEGCSYTVNENYGIIEIKNITY
jgi:hypothetical protein